MVSALGRAGASLGRLLVKPKSLHCYYVEAVALRYASMLCSELSASTKAILVIEIQLGDTKLD